MYLTGNTLRLRYEPNRLMLSIGLWPWYINTTVTNYLLCGVSPLPILLRYEIESLGNPIRNKFPTLYRSSCLSVHFSWCDSNRSRSTAFSAVLCPFFYAHLVIVRHVGRFVHLSAPFIRNWGFCGRLVDSPNHINWMPCNGGIVWRVYWKGWPPSLGID
jgi:hypothetical protein